MNTYQEFLKAHEEVKKIDFNKMRAGMQANAVKEDKDYFEKHRSVLEKYNDLKYRLLKENNLRTLVVRVKLNPYKYCRKYLIGRKNSGIEAGELKIMPDFVQELNKRIEVMLEKRLKSFFALANEKKVIELNAGFIKSFDEEVKNKLREIRKAKKMHDKIQEKINKLMQLKKEKEKLVKKELLASHTEL